LFNHSVDFNFDRNGHLFDIAADGETTPLHIISLGLVLIIGILAVVSANQKENKVSSKTYVKPKLEIKTVTNDSTVVSADTTYIYSFKKDLN